MQSVASQTTTICLAGEICICLVRRYNETEFHTVGGTCTKRLRAGKGRHHLFWKLLDARSAFRFSNV